MEITKEIIEVIAKEVETAKLKLVAQTWARIDDKIALCRYQNVDVEGAILFINKKAFCFFKQEDLDVGVDQITLNLTASFNLLMNKKFETLSRSAIQQFIEQGEFEADGIRIYKSQMTVVDIWSYNIESDSKVLVTIPIGDGMEQSTQVTLCNSLKKVMVDRFETGRTSFFLEEPGVDSVE